MATGETSTVSTADKLEEVLRVVRDVEAKVDTKFSEMKREIGVADDRLVKKIRLDNKPTFKKRGHEEALNTCLMSKSETRWMQLHQP